MSLRIAAVSLLLSALVPATPAIAAATATLKPSKPACEPFTDPRELRFRAPTAVVAGRIAADSVREDRPESPEFGMQLVFGSAVIVADGGQRIPVNYAYWLSNADCSGWEPAQGATLLFDLVDDKAKDGTLRVMRYGSIIGAPR